MTTKTACCPRRMTDLAIHRRVVVCETNAPAVVGIVDPGFRLAAFSPTGITDAGYSPPGFSIALQCFRVSRFGIVMRRERINRVDRLWNLPTNIRRHCRLLPKLVSFPKEARPERRVAGIKQIDLAGVATCDQRRPLLDCAVIIDTCGRGGVARLTVEHAVAVNVGVEMTIT